MPDFAQIREQLLTDSFPNWNAYTWGASRLLHLIDRAFVDRANQDSFGVVSEMSAVGFDRFEVRAIVDVSEAPSREIYVEVRYLADVRFLGRAARREENRARALGWKPARMFELGPVRTLFRTVQLPLDVLVVLSPSGRFKSAELRNFGYARGIIGRPRYSHLDSDD